MDPETTTRRAQAEEIKRLRARVAELERAQLSQEQRLQLAILEKCPFTMWACDRNFKIVLWNARCAEVYGVDSDSAKGQDYAKLFVDAIEEQQSREDCLKIIKDGVTFKNFLAYDHDSSSGIRRTMLTNCFRTWDEERHDYIQVEVALEISDLQLRIDEHRTLREVGVAHLEAQKQLITLRKQDLLSRIAALVGSTERAVDKQEESLAGFIDELREQGVDPSKTEELASGRRAMLLARREECERWSRRVQAAVLQAASDGDLETLETEVRARGEANAKEKGVAT